MKSKYLQRNEWVRHNHHTNLQLPATQASWIRALHTIVNLQAQLHRTSLKAIVNVPTGNVWLPYD